MKFSVIVATLLMSVAMPAPTAPRGTPTAARHISDAQITSVLEKGGPILQEPGLEIVAERRAPSAAAVDQTRHHIFLIEKGEATLVTGGKLAGKAIEGGQNRRLKTGDMIVIPAKTPY